MNDFCPRVEGNWEDPNAVFVGSIGFGGDADLDTRNVNDAVDQGYDLAVDEWRDNNGLPGVNGTRRQIAFVHCYIRAWLHDQWGADTQTITQHLAGDVKAPLIYNNWDYTVADTLPTAQATNTMVMCTVCENSDLPKLPSNGLLWNLLQRTADSAPVFQYFINRDDPLQRAAHGLGPTDKLKLAVVAQNTVALSALTDKILENLSINGAPVNAAANAAYVKRVAADEHFFWGDTASAFPAAQEVVDFQPNMVIFIDHLEASRYVLPLVEGMWPSSVPRPHYIVTGGSATTSLTAAVGQNDELRHRIAGVSPGWDPEAFANATPFAQRFKARFPNSVNDPYGFPVIPYEGFYATAYAMAAAGPGTPLSGSVIAAAMSKIGSGPKINTAPGSIAAGMAALGFGGSIDLVGTETSLDFDLTTRENRGPQWGFCVARDGTEPVLNMFAGPIWSNVSGQVEGEFDCP